MSPRNDVFLVINRGFSLKEWIVSKLQDNSNDILIIKFRSNPPLHQTSCTLLVQNGTMKSMLDIVRTRINYILDVWVPKLQIDVLWPYEPCDMKWHYLDDGIFKRPQRYILSWSARRRLSSRFINSRACWFELSLNSKWKNWEWWQLPSGHVVISKSREFKVI